MNLSTALRELGSPGVDAPLGALEWSLAHWDVVGEAFQQILARCAKDPEGAPDKDMIVSYSALHLMAEKRETRAFPLLCALAKSPEGLPAILGGAMEVSLTGIMISLFNGDAAALKAVIETESTDFGARACAFDALAYLTAAGRIPREETAAWLASYPARARSLDPLDAGWEAWAGAVALLGLADLMPEVRKACDDALIDPTFVTYDDLKILFDLAKEERSGMAGFEREGIAPLDDALDELSKIEEILDAEAEDEDYPAQGAADAGEPAANPFRDVGRNDPCPCGSGKKFKKCCLV